VTSDGTIWHPSAGYFLSTQQGVSAAGTNWTKIPASFFLLSVVTCSATGSVTNGGDGALSNLEAVMIKRKHINHAELLDLGKMILLLIKRQQIKSNLSSLTRLDERLTAEKLPRAS
jgi:hypothetical protein